MRVGLGKVLIKVTGDSQTLTTVRFSDPKQYVAEFGYVTLTGSQETGSLGMKLSYAPSAVNRLLREHSLQVWPSDRPDMLVWAVVDDPVAGRVFISSEQMSEANALLQQLMDDRGAPLVLPLLDLQDSQNLAVSDVWNMNTEQLKLAAERYDTELWMAIRLYKSSSGQWQATRLLNQGSDEVLDNMVAPTLSSVMNKVVTGAIDRVASRYAYIPTENTEVVRLQLENINNFQNFNAATTYLESLEVVRRLMVAEVDGQRLVLNLFVEGDTNLLLNTLKRDRRMMEQSPAIYPIPVDVTPQMPVSDLPVTTPTSTSPLLSSNIPLSSVTSALAVNSHLGASEIDVVPSVQPTKFFFVWGQR